MSGEDDLPSHTDILRVLRESRRGALKPKELASQLGVATSAYAGLKGVLAVLERDG